MKKIIFSIFLLAYIGKAIAQDEIIYSQYMFNNLIVNPAYAGYKEDVNVSLLSRNQWVGIKGAPTTQSLIADGAFTKNKNVGLGLSIMNDKVGIQSQTSVMANYAYRLPVGDNGRLSFGLGVGAVQFTLNGDKAVVSNPDDINFAGSETFTSPDARVGLYYSNNLFYAGLSANNLLTKALNSNNQQASYVVLPAVHLFLNAGAIFDVNADIKMKPSFMLRDKPTGMGNFDVSTSFLFRETVSIGASYRIGVDMWKKGVNVNQSFQQNSLVGLAELFIAKKFRIGYAYDYSLSDLNTYSSGSHEISLGLIIGNKDYRNKGLTSPRYF